MKQLFTLLLALLELLRGFGFKTIGGKQDILVETEPSTSYTIDLSQTRAPNVLSVTVDDAVEPYIRNMLDVHVLHTDVVGLFGCPVEVTADELENAVLTFEYDPENMKNVPAKNLIGLYYNEEEYNYEEILGELDESACTVTFDITREGSYMLVDAFEWLSVWGVDASEYSHPLEYVYEGRTYPEYYPGFSAIIPDGTMLNRVWGDLENKDSETGLIHKMFFDSSRESAIEIDSEVIHGNNAWDQALKDCEYMKSSPVIDDMLGYTYLGELVNEKDRMICELEGNFNGEKSYTVIGYFYVGTRQCVSVTASVSASSDETAKENVRAFMRSLKFWDAGKRDDVVIGDDEYFGDE